MIFNYQPHAAAARNFHAQSLLCLPVNLELVSIRVTGMFDVSSRTKACPCSPHAILYVRLKSSFVRIPVTTRRRPCSYLARGCFPFPLGAIVPTFIGCKWDHQCGRIGCISHDIEDRSCRLILRRPIQAITGMDSTFLKKELVDGLVACQWRMSCLIYLLDFCSGRYHTS